MVLQYSVGMAMLMPNSVGKEMSVGMAMHSAGMETTVGMATYSVGRTAPVGMAMYSVGMMVRSAARRMAMSSAHQRAASLGRRMNPQFARWLVGCSGVL